MSDLEWFPAEPETAQSTVSTVRVHRHKWATMADDEHGVYSGCIRCGVIQDPVKSRRGLNNRKRGNSIERDVLREMGIEPVGRFGGAEDGRNAIFSAQVKSGGWYSPREMDETQQARPAQDAPTRQGCDGTDGAEARRPGDVLPRRSLRAGRRGRLGNGLTASGLARSLRCAAGADAMKLRAVLLTVLPLAFAAILWRRRPATRLDDGPWTGIEDPRLALGWRW